MRSKGVGVERSEQRDIYKKVWRNEEKGDIKEEQATKKLMNEIGRERKWSKDAQERKTRVGVEYDHATVRFVPHFDI